MWKLEGSLEEIPWGEESMIQELPSNISAYVCTKNCIPHFNSPALKRNILSNYNSANSL